MIALLLERGGVEGLQVQATTPDLGKLSGDQIPQGLAADPLRRGAERECGGGRAIGAQRAVAACSELLGLEPASSRV